MFGVFPSSLFHSGLGICSCGNTIGVLIYHGIYKLYFAKFLPCSCSYFNQIHFISSEFILDLFCWQKSLSEPFWHLRMFFLRRGCSEERAMISCEYLFKLLILRILQILPGSHSKCRSRSIYIKILQDFCKIFAG